MRNLLAVVAMFTLSGCGALFVGTTQSISINSSPVGSKIELDGGVYTTPATIELARN